MQPERAIFIILTCGAIFQPVRSQKYNCSYDSYSSSLAVFKNVKVQSSDSPTFTCSLKFALQNVTFTNASLAQVPKSLFDTHTSLSNVNLTSSGIKNINRYSLQNAKQLSDLDLSHNELQELTGYCFSGANALTFLYLSHNIIRTIDNTAFSSLTQLLFLNLNHNMLRVLDSNVFAMLGSLKYLYLSSNELQTVQKGLFSKNTNLDTIDLSRNNISTVEAGALVIGASGKSTNVLSYLSLSSNNLSTLNLVDVKVKTLMVYFNVLKEISISPWIEEIDADYNCISLIVLTNASTDMRLHTLRLESNSIASLESIGQLQSLKHLDLSNNQMRPLNLTSFTKLTNLERLELRRTSISNLRHGTFAQQKSLKWLDISYNKLEQFDFDILNFSTNLEKIFLDGNRLKSIEFAQLKRTFPSLNQIGVEDNNWNCSHLIKLVRYCNDSSIDLFKLTSVIRYQTNVEGIYCYDDRDSQAIAINTQQQMEIKPYLSNTSTHDGLQAMQTSVPDALPANQSFRLDGALYDLMKNMSTLQKDLSGLRQSMFEMRLALLSNRTNASADAVNVELRRIIETANNLTLDKHELEFKIYQQTLKVEMALNIAKEGRQGNHSGVGIELAALARQLGEVQPNAEGSSHGVGLIIAVLVMNCLLMGVFVFVLLKTYRQPFSVARMHYIPSDGCVTTILDNDV
uniref:Leucine rich immune protein (TM) n=1 Tax=Anopheles dirus TaxID=7168 RepID=A0A182NVR4_9DIPT